jgi:hypothetical protein
MPAVDSPGRTDELDELLDVVGATDHRGDVPPKSAVATSRAKVPGSSVGRSAGSWAGVGDEGDHGADDDAAPAEFIGELPGRASALPSEAKNARSLGGNCGRVLSSCRPGTGTWWRSAKISTSLSRALTGRSRSNAKAFVTLR